MNNMYYVPFEECARVLELPGDSIVKAGLFADICRINALYMISKAGSGHIGTSFSCLDMLSWLYLNEVYRSDADGENIYFSSKGHDAPAMYAVLLGLGYLEFSLIHLLRRLGGLPGHPDVSVPFAETNTGSLGMGISKAKGMIFSNRLDGKKQTIYVITGDGELQEGQIWEALRPAVNNKMAELVVIVDHNKIQSDTWVSQTSDLGDLEARFGSHGWHVERCDGHDLRQFAEKIAKCQQIEDRPKVIIADTVKGKGVSFMEYSSMGFEGHEDSLYPFHSGALESNNYSKAIEELLNTVHSKLSTLDGSKLRYEAVTWPEKKPAEKVERLIPGYSRELCKQAEKNKNIVVLDADLVADCGLLAFRERFPERFIECGIAEQDMVSQAGGLALKGKLPIAHSFACFLTPRANEQIYNNATEQTKIIYLGALAGLLPGTPGHSHQAVRDISSLAAIPGLVIIEPGCERELAAVLDFAINQTDNSVYLRLTSIPVHIPFDLASDYVLRPGQGTVLHDGNDVAIFAYGPVMLAEAWKSVELLKSRGIGARLINLPWLNSVDSEWLAGILQNVRGVVTLDNHYIKGGQGEMLFARLFALGMQFEFSLALGLDKLPVCGTNDEVLSHHGLDADSIAKSIVRLL